MHDTNSPTLRRSLVVKRVRMRATFKKTLPYVGDLDQSLPHDRVREESAVESVRKGLGDRFEGQREKLKHKGRHR